MEAKETIVTEPDARRGGALVSVIIPAYNVRPYIGECLKSIREQTYQNLEIIVVDDGSTDGTGECCDAAAALDSRVTVLHKDNGGVVSARNAGIRHSHGQYLVFVDGDDWIDADMVEEMVARAGGADLVSTGVYQEKSPGYIIESTDRFEPGLYEGDEAMEYLYGRMIYDAGTERLQPLTPWIYNKLYVRKKVLAICERVSESLAFAEDSVFLYLYMLECRSVVICRKCCYHYRYREGSAIHRVNEHMLIDINKVYMALLDEFRGHRMGKELLFQLQKWVLVRACVAINETMGFDRRIHLWQYVFNTKGLENKRIVLYGAGRAGRDIHRQLVQFDYRVVLWVDRGYQWLRTQGFDVYPPEAVSRCGYDVLVIAVEDRKLAQEIRESLKEYGVPEEKVLWERPLKMY